MAPYFSDTPEFDKDITLSGYGTSLNIEYAIERALLEFKQTIDLLKNDTTLPKDDGMKENMENNNCPDFFMKLYYYNPRILFDLPRKKLDDLRKKYDKGNLSPCDMLDYILKRLQKYNYNIFYNQVNIKIKDGAIIYIKAVIPTMCDITDPGPLRLPSKRKILDIKGVSGREQ